MFNVISSDDALWRQLGCATWELTSNLPTWKAFYIDWLRTATREYKMTLAPGSHAAKFDDHDKDDTKCDIMLRFIVLGSRGVGKRSLLLSYIGDSSADLMRGHIGFKIKCVQIKGLTVKLMIYDIAHVEQFRSLSTVYFRNVDGILLAYDVTNRWSFNQIPDWLNGFEWFAAPTAMLTLLGNKMDLEETRKVSTEEGQRLAQSHGLSFLETSATTGENVESAFYTTLEHILFPMRSLARFNRQAGVPCHVPSDEDLAYFGIKHRVMEPSILQERKQDSSYRCTTQ